MQCPIQSLEMLIEFSQAACPWAYVQFRPATDLWGKYVNTWDISSVSAVAVYVSSKKKPQTKCRGNSRVLWAAN